jgi:galactokinase
MDGLAGSELASRHARAFRESYGGAKGMRLFFAPGRVNLMGAHLDYNGGPVMPMAIDRGTFIALRPRTDRRVCLRSTSEKGETALELGEGAFARRGQWADYPSGVIANLLPRAPAAPGLDVLFGGNLPVGAGLSSSASICVGTAFALAKAWNLTLSPLESARVALTAEREFVGVRCGIMDPYAVGLARAGHLLWLDCKDASYEHLPVDHGSVSVAVADSGVRRELAQGAFNQRVAEAARAFEVLRPYAELATCLRDVPLEVYRERRGMLDEVTARRAEHVIREVRRTFEARERLLAGDLAGFGARMVETHQSLRELYEVSVSELDCLVEAAVACPGVHGARLTGAGFGGCVVILVDKRAARDAASNVADAFARRFDRRPTVELFGGDEGPRELAYD